MTEQNDKNIISLSIYKIDDITSFYAYTALWCGPCKRIKPKMIEIMSKHNHNIVSDTIIQKSDFKKDINDFVPFFVIFKNDKKVDSIQTSDEILFTQFLTKNGIGKLKLDEDF